MSQILNYGPGTTPVPGTVLFLEGDLGGDVGPDGSGVIHVIANNASVNAGSSVLFVGNTLTNTITLDVTDVNNSTLIGLNAGNLTISGINNTGLGQGVLHALTTGANNTALGESAATAITSANGNTAIGSGALSTATSGIGHNTAIGFDSLLNLTMGHDNIALGYQAAQNYTSTETNNIVIGNTGTAADAGIIRIGTSGTHIENFQAGIAGVTVSNQKSVVINSTTGQLGVDSGAITVQTITGNDGVVESPSANNFNFLTANSTVKFIGSSATETLDFNRTTNLMLGSSLPSLTTGNNNVGVGYQTGNGLTSGSSNSLLGYQAGVSLTSGGNNVAVGYQALNTNSLSNQNTAIGFQALKLITAAANTAVGYLALSNAANTSDNVAIGSQTLGSFTQSGSGSDNNVAVGDGVLSGLLTGRNNFAFGQISGISGFNGYTGSESNNALFANKGVTGDSAVIRIGTPTVHTSNFQAGVYGVSVSSPQVVTITSTGQLGSQAIPSSSITITGDSGSISGNALTIYANNAANNAGSSVKFVNSGTTSTLNVTDANNNTAIGNTAGNASLTGIANTALGKNALLTTTTGNYNTALGVNTLSSNATGSSNVAVGYNALTASTSDSNVAIGFGASGNLASGTQTVSIGKQALLNATAGNGTVAIGSNALGNLLTGSNNIAIGYFAGQNYTSSEANNIILGNNGGIVGESNVIRIGNGQTTAYMAGIYGVSPSSPQMCIVNASGQLGSQNFSTISGYIKTISGDSAGTVQPDPAGFYGQNGILMAASTNGANAGSTVAFVPGGSPSALMKLSTTDAQNNIAIGAYAGSLFNGSNSGNSVCIGSQAGYNLTGAQNTLIGRIAGLNLTTGTYNTYLGYSAGGGSGTITGSYNTFVGSNTGTAYTGTEANNIIIGSQITGTASESNKLRIGAGTGTGNGQLNGAFISGIQGITVTGTAVLVSSSDQLGIAVSSQRFKENIKPLESTKVLQLNPVSFQYKLGDDRCPQTGLIAEQVYDIMPELVVLDKEGLPQSVKYHDLPVLLLLEIQKLNARIDALEKR